MSHARGFNAQPSYRIDALTRQDLDEVLGALRAAFGGPFDPDWFSWKHESAPWGRSRGWVARDASGFLGVRLFLPWEFRLGDAVYRAFRPCDTVTVHRAQGQGVFTTLTSIAMEEIGDEVDFYFNTPNERSRPGYLKMGYVEWATVRQRVGFIRPTPIQLGNPVGRADAPDVMATSMSDEYLDWRYRLCPRYRYGLFGDPSTDEPNGIVCRVRRWRNQRLLVVSELWGSLATQRALVRGAAAHFGTRAVWLTHAQREAAGLSFATSGTVVTRRDVGVAPPPVPAFSVGDIEDVI